MYFCAFDADILGFAPFYPKEEIIAGRRPGKGDKSFRDTGPFEIAGSGWPGININRAETRQIHGLCDDGVQINGDDKWGQFPIIWARLLGKRGGALFFDTKRP